MLLHRTLCGRLSNTAFQRTSQSHIFRFVSYKVYGLETRTYNRCSMALGTKSKLATIQRIEKLGLPKPTVTSQTYAILISLCMVEGVPSLLYTLRSNELKSHSGQVSFPGGRCDASDRDVIHAASREAEEEIGIPQSAIDVWAVMPPIGRELDKPIYPVVGNLGNLLVDDLEHNDAEVSTIFTVPLEFLCNPQNYRHTWFRRVFSVGHSVKHYIYPTPVFLTKPRVWGLTAMATELFLSCLFPDIFPKPYSRFLPI